MSTWTEAFHAEGYAVVRGVLGAAEVAGLQQATDALQEQAQLLTHDTKVRGVFFEMQSASGKKREVAVHPGALRKITSPSRGEPAFAALRRDPRLLALVHDAGLRAPRCVVDQVNFKHPQTGTGFPFHQDVAFLHGDALRDLQRFGGVNLVLALDTADAENGGFTVLGGTHARGFLPGQRGYDTSTTNVGVFDETRAAIPALSPGDAVLFHPLLAHGSGPNRSARRRRLVTLWFTGTAAAAQPLGQEAFSPGAVSQGARAQGEP